MMLKLFCVPILVLVMFMNGCAVSGDVGGFALSARSEPAGIWDFNVGAEKVHFDAKFNLNEAVEWAATSIRDIGAAFVAPSPVSTVPVP